MHDEVLTLIDGCVSRLLEARQELAAARRVHPGERRTAVLHAISAAEEFSAAAHRTVGEPQPHTGASH